MFYPIRVISYSSKLEKFSKWKKVARRVALVFSFSLRKMSPLRWGTILIGRSVTRFCDFWKFLMTNYLSKEAQMFGYFWGILKTLLFTY